MKRELYTNDIDAYNRCLPIIMTNPDLRYQRYAADLAAHLYLAQQEVSYPDWREYVPSDPSELRQLIYAQSSSKHAKEVGES